MAPSLNQYKRLDKATKSAILRRCTLRIRRKADGYPSAKVLIVGDRPAPSAPDAPDFHYTPFAALWNSSLFVNLELHKADIQEEDLAWENAASLHGVPNPPVLLEREWKLIIALGGNAEKWVKKAGHTCVKINHPAYHKRFRGAEPYELADLIKSVTVSAV